MTSESHPLASWASEAGSPHHARYPTRIRASIYWADLLASTCLGWGLFAMSATMRSDSLAAVLVTIGAILALLRSLTFIHELAHRGREIPGFETAWNLLVGIPMVVPSLLYVGSHSSHHRTDRFGTPADPEYAPLAGWGTSRKLLFVAASGLTPVALALRWGILGPLSLVVPRLRPWVVGKLSTLAINAGYVREAPRGADRRRWIAEEIATTTFVWSAALALSLSLLPAALAVHWLVVVASVFIVNQARTVLAHRYAGDGEPVDEQGQLLDTLTLPPHSWLAAMIAPLGLRYHALHHWAPGIAYHDLGRVHRSLVADSAQEDPYLRTVAPSLVAGIRMQLRQSGDPRQLPSPKEQSTRRP